MTASDAQFDNVAVIKKANVFDGKCISHTVMFADGTRKTVGVMLPGTELTFNVGVSERMETVAGGCRYRLAGEDWKKASVGESFSIPANTAFDIAIGDEAYHYVCHFG
jgi:uncharacterized protein YaiE (UPF0345 family)